MAHLTMQSMSLLALCICTWALSGRGEVIELTGLNFELKGNPCNISLGRQSTRIHSLLSASLVASCRLKAPMSSSSAVRPPSACAPKRRKGKVYWSTTTFLNVIEYQESHDGKKQGWH